MTKNGDVWEVHGSHVARVMLKSHSKEMEASIVVPLMLMRIKACKSGRRFFGVSAVRFEQVVVHRVGSLQTRVRLKKKLVGMRSSVILKASKDSMAIYHGAPFYFTQPESTTMNA